MKRRSFLAGLLLAPLAKFLPTPKPAPVYELWKCGIDMAHGSDSTSIWLIEWGDRHGPWHSTSPGGYVHQIRTMDRPVRINFLKRELNK